MIKPNCFVLVLALSATVTTVGAAPGGADSVGARTRQDHVRPDGDRQASRHRIRRMFSALDTDESGAITLDEFLVRPLARAPTQFARIDVDGDGLVSYEEFSAGHAGDPDIDVDELRACVEETLGVELADRPDAETRFNLIDSNADGSIDVDEFTTAKSTGATDRFYDLDIDGDSAITPVELVEALLARHKHRKARRQCAEEQRDLLELFSD